MDKWNPSDHTVSPPGTDGTGETRRSAPDGSAGSSGESRYTPPEDAGDWTEQMARLEEGAGQGTPVQEEALPVGAKAVGEPERREEPEENEHLG